jgi:uncharacterized protein YjbI with pentapeptide repeats
MQSIIQHAVTQASQTTKGDLAVEKARQDLIAMEIDNKGKDLPWYGQFSALISTLVATSGAVLALRSYFAAREKERQDRLAALLSETLSRLVGTEARQRVLGAAGLVSFFNLDRADFHLQALTALIAAARVKNEEREVRQGLRLGIELACRSLSVTILRQVPWQGVKCPDVSLPNQDLSKLDFRDADLQNANFRAAVFDGSEFGGAELQGAQLQGASLNGAKLIHCDLAGADLTGASLNAADLTGVKVLHANMDGADLRGSPKGVLNVPWDLTENWQRANFDPDVRSRLNAKFPSN